MFFHIAGAKTVKNVGESLRRHEDGAER